MGQGGLEPPTPRLSSVCSNQLSYWPQAPIARPPNRRTHFPGSRDPRPDRSGPTQPAFRSHLQSNTHHPNHYPGQDTRSAPGGTLAPPRRRRPVPAPGSNPSGLDLVSWQSSVARAGRLAPPHPGSDQATKASGMNKHSVRTPAKEPSKRPAHRHSLKGGDPAAGSPTATLLRLHPSR